MEFKERGRKPSWWNLIY